VDEARQNCERALALNRHLVETLITMGRIDNGTGRYNQAVARFLQTIELDRRNPDAFEGLGRAYSELGDLEKAEATYQKAVELRPGDWNAYKQLGLYYYRQADYRSAIAQFDTVVSLTPDNAHGYANLGAFHYFLGEYQSAKAAWGRALQLDPNRASVQTNLAKLAFEEGEFEEARSRYESIVETSDSSFIAWGNLAATYNKLGDKLKSVEAYKMAETLVAENIKVNPKRANLRTHYAHYLAWQGKAEKAAGELAKAVELEPDDPDVLIRAAQTWAHLGDREHARSLVDRALELGYSRHALNRVESLRTLVTQ
jgi:tetratricopeptide (TPR) repeat protein